VIRGRWVATAAIAAIVTLGFAAPATAQTAAPDPTTIHLDWDGAAAETADESFVGVPVAVPGDRAVRALRVRNDGPSTGVLRAWVQQVELLEPADDEGFYDDLRLDWHTAAGRHDASFRDLERTGRTQITETQLQAGESTVLTVGYTFPVEATTGNRSVVGAREASFVVHLDLRGELPPDDGAPDVPEPGVDDPADPTDPADPSDPADPADPTAPADTTDPAPGVVPGPSGGGDLAQTGAEALQVALLAVTGIGLGGILLGAARRRQLRNAGGSSPSQSTVSERDER
jgi:hypothetical protein